MKIRTLISSSAIALLATTSFVLAGEYTSGEIKKIDMKNKVVTIKHGEIKNLEMPGMTMMFHPAHDEMLEHMKAGDKIEFIADRVEGKLTIKEVKK